MPAMTKNARERVKKRAFALGLLALQACSTRFVDLDVPAGTGGSPASQVDASGQVKCETVKRSDGSECQICYAPDGTLVKGGCVPTAGGTVAPVNDGGNAMCKVAPIADNSRCLSCVGSPADYTVCLKCEPPIKTPVPGETCRTCFWNDQKVSCLQCFAANGTITHDDCDASRSEIFPHAIVPSK
jgi:putative hemolysin